MRRLLTRGLRSTTTELRCIDLNGSSPLAHYVIVRADLPVGSQVAQTVHAAGESALPRPIPGTIAVALHARDEEHLKDVALQLAERGITYHCVHEALDDAKYPGQLMAIGIHPTSDRLKLRRALSSLPLVK